MRIGVQSYSFRTMPLDDAIKAMTDIGIGECELFSGHVEPRPPPGAFGGPGAPPVDPAVRAAWRGKTPRLAGLTTPLDHFAVVRKKGFDAAGIKLQAYNLSFNDSFTDAGNRIAGSGDGQNARRWVYHGVVDVDGGEARRTARGKTPDDGRDARAREPRRSERVREAEALRKGDGDVEAFRGQPRYRPLLRRRVRSPSLHPAAPRSDHEPSSEGSQEERRAQHALGRGDTPIKEVLNLLKTKKYDIPANIEYEYKGEDTAAEVRKCFEYCRAALGS